MSALASAPLAIAPWLLDVQAIYHEPAVLNHARGREILDRFPEAERVVVESHWNIAGLHGSEGNVEDWIAIKRNVIVLGVKSSLSARPNTRSSDFVAPSHANGCAMACSYRYVPRRKGFANPITTFVNIEQICRYLTRHAGRQGWKSEPNQIDPKYWVYDIGENSDCSVDALICDNVSDLIGVSLSPERESQLRYEVCERELLKLDPQRKTRIRFSLMPHRLAKAVDVRTSPVRERIAAINEFHMAGYEVHLNFSPVIYYDRWMEDYRELFLELADTLSPSVKEQLAAEIIFLTHNDRLHEINLGWHPKGEEYLWKPELQETKYSQTGGRNLRYKRGFKAELVRDFCDLLNQHLPECRIRYAF